MKKLIADSLGNGIQRDELILRSEGNLSDLNGDVSMQAETSRKRRG